MERPIRRGLKVYQVVWNRMHGYEETGAVEERSVGHKLVWVRRILGRLRLSGARAEKAMELARFHPYGAGKRAEVRQWGDPLHGPGSRLGIG
ncbi:MAG: hypothetical protein QW057_07715 [Candidatus Bathyarchaeia archaeon]